MQIEQLRQFVTVAEIGVVSHAADELDMSQPALSRSLRRLEAELGHALFDRTGNSVELNAAGRLALDHAREILRSTARLKDELARLDAAEQTITIGTCAPAPLWMLTSWIVQAMPGTPISAETLEEQALERRFLNGSLDFAITLHPIHLPGVFSKAMMTEHLFVWAPAAHRLAERDSVTFAELAGETFLVAADIGSWSHVHDTIDADFIVQPDREIFAQMVRSSPHLAFTTDAVAFMRDPAARRVAVPITDASAYATFYLSMRIPNARHGHLAEELRRRLS